MIQVKTRIAEHAKNAEMKIEATGAGTSLNIGIQALRPRGTLHKMGIAPALGKMRD